MYICKSWKLVREHFDKSYFDTLLILKVESFKLGEQWAVGGYKVFANFSFERYIGSVQRDTCGSKMEILQLFAVKVLALYRTAKN